MRQHGDIGVVFDEVEAASGEERRHAFRRLVRLLAVHETAEGEVVHPFPGVPPGRRTGRRGATRRGEHDQRGPGDTRRTGHAALDDPDADDPTFMPRFIKLRTDVQEHARAEERYEFVHIRRSTDRPHLAAMAKAVEAAEAMAPTRPHPGVESGGASVALAHFVRCTLAPQPGDHLLVCPPGARQVGARG